MEFKENRENRENQASLGLKEKEDFKESVDLKGFKEIKDL